MALERINAVIAQQPWFLPALIEKANLLISMHDWDEAMDVIMQVLQQEPDNIDALHLSGNAYDSTAVVLFTCIANMPQQAYSGIMHLHSCQVIAQCYSRNMKCQGSAPIR